MPKQLRKISTTTVTEVTFTKAEIEALIIQSVALTFNPKVQFIWSGKELDFHDAEDEVLTLTNTVTEWEA